MLFRSKDLEAIFSGAVTTAFRRWKKPTVRVGGTVRTARGLVGIDAIEVIDPATLTEADAVAANYPSLSQLIGMFDSQEGTCYRIRLHPAGPDPRDALRESDQLTDADRELLAAKVRKVERGTETLSLIADHPAVVSTELAGRLGMDRLVFKENVRKLKALGLTESLDVGYRLSPRGAAFLRRS